MSILLHIIFPIIIIGVSIYAIIEPLKCTDAFKLDIKMFKKNKATLISSRRSYAICLLIEGIAYSVLSIRILLKQVTLSSIERCLIILLIALIPLPLIFIIHFIKFDKEGNLRRTEK